MRLFSGLSVARPKARRFEPEQTRSRHVSRLDTEHAARMELLPYDGKDAPLSQAMERESSSHGIEHRGGLQELLDAAGIEQKELSIARQWSTPQRRLRQIGGLSNRRRILACRPP
jgi:hypothetical protein